MAKIQYIKSSKSGATYLLGVISDEGDARYKIPSVLYHELGEPLRGGELTDAELDEIKRADEGGRATKKALSLLSYADSSERGIKMKLRRAGYSAEVAEETARDMVRHGYIDEQRQLLRLVESEANLSLSGPAKIIQKLMAKGYSSQKISKVIFRLCEDGTVDFTENSLRLLEKKLPSDATAEEKRKLLYKCGYRS